MNWLSYSIVQLIVVQKEIPRYHRIQEALISAVDTSLSQRRRVDIFTLCFCKINFNIIISYVPNYLKMSLPLWFPDQNFACTSQSPYACRMPLIWRPNNTLISFVTICMWPSYAVRDEISRTHKTGTIIT